MSKGKKLSREVLDMLLDIGSGVARQVFDAVSRGDVDEVRRLAETWPEPLALKAELLAAEAEARRIALEG